MRNHPLDMQKTQFLKATIKGRYFQFGNPDEAYKLFLELDHLSDGKFAREAWDERLMRSSKEARLGLLSEETMTQSIVEWKEQLKRAGRPLKVAGRADEVFDFAFTRRVIAELKTEGFDPKKYRYVSK